MVLEGHYRHTEPGKGEKELSSSVGQAASFWGSSSVFEHYIFMCTATFKVPSTQAFQNSQCGLWSQNLSTSRWALRHPFLPRPNHAAVGKGPAVLDTPRPARFADIASHPAVTWP